MHKVLQRRAKNNKYLQRLFDLLVYQNPHNDWIEDADLVRWCGERNGPPVEAVDRIDETSFIYTLEVLATRGRLSKWSFQDLVGELPDDDAEPAFLLAMKVDEEGRKFYRLNFAELLIEKREFTPLQQLAETVVQKHEALLERRHERSTAGDLRSLWREGVD